MASAMLPVAEGAPPRAKPARSVRRQPAGSRWSGTTARCALTLAAGSLHATGWVFPGAWYAVWPAQCALIALGAITTPRKAVLYGSAAGAIGIASSFYWGVDALRQTFDASSALAWIVFVLLVAFESLGFGLFCASVSYAARRGAP